MASVDLSQTAERVRLTSKELHDPQALLVLAPQSLRQWLGIVHVAYRKAGWPMVLWPD